LKFELFEVKVPTMADVDIEPQLETEIEIKFNQESERTVKSDSSLCVSVCTQCVQKKDDDSIVVMKFSYSDSEDTVTGNWEVSQVVSVLSFNMLFTNRRHSKRLKRSYPLRFSRQAYNFGYLNAGPTLRICVLR
jgi:uncharacterized protein YycO